MKKNILVLLVALFVGVFAKAQNMPDPFIVTAGEDIVDAFNYDHQTNANDPDYFSGVVTATAKEVYIETSGDDFALMYYAPASKDAKIVGISEVEGFLPDYEELTVLVTFSDGSGVVVHFDLTNGAVTNSDIIAPATNTGTPITVGSGPYYRLTSNLLYSSADSGHSWALDTIGLHGVNLHSVAIDTFKNVFLATDNGLYEQAINSTNWTMNASCPVSSTTKVFIDHQNRIWTYGYNTTLGEYNLSMSLTDGVSWGIDSLGIQYVPVENIGGDNQGNIFLVGNTGTFYNKGNQLYKSIGGTLPFVRIDQGIQALNSQAADSGIFTVITGDSANLYAGGSRGLFKSTDGGNTWAAAKGIRSDQVYGLVATGNNQIVISNSLACYTATAGSPLWTKTYPTNGYNSIGKPLYKDDAGDIYAQLPIDNGGQYNGPYIVVKSTDNAATWNPDTAGISITEMYSWWVDEAGDQYAGGTDYTASGLPVYRKSNAGVWAIDTVGFAYDNTYDVVLAFGSDHNGTVYASTFSGNVQSQPIAGGAWTVESNINSDQVYSLAHTSDHTMIAGGVDNIHYKSATGWQNMLVNSPAPGGTAASAVAADDSDYVWAAFSHQDASGNYVGDGVFFTHDYGNTWFAPGGQVTVATFRSLVPVGDSVLGLTYSDGVFVFKREFAPDGIATLSGAQQLVIYPNPAVKECHALFTLPAGSKNNELVIRDIMGKTVQQVAVNNAANNMSFSTSEMSAGIYFCTLLSDGKTVEVGKLAVSR